MAAGVWLRSRPPPAETMPGVSISEASSRRLPPLLLLPLRVDIAQGDLDQLLDAHPVGLDSRQLRRSQSLLRQLLGSRIIARVRGVSCSLQLLLRLAKL